MNNLDIETNKADDRAYSALLDIPIQDYSVCYDENGVEIQSTTTSFSEQN